MLPGSLANNSPSRLPQLDGVRGLAILLVIVWHYIASIPGADPLAAQLFRLTWSGVDLFFVLSGFLIGGILIDHREASNYFKVFYARRVARIFPLYFAWLALFILLSGSRAPLFASPLPLWSYATFTQNITMAAGGGMGAGWMAMTWSLAVEEQFYLLLPLVIRYLSPRYLPFLLVAVIAFTPLLRLGLALLFQSTFPNYVLLPTRADALAMGVFCAWLLRQHRAALDKYRRQLWIVFGLCGAGYILLLGADPGHPSVTTVAFNYSLFAFLYGCFILLAVVDRRVGRVASFPPLRACGILAYALYLFHQPVLSVAEAVLGRSPAVTICALGAALCLAFLSWKFFEKPILARAQRLAYVP